MSLWDSVARYIPKASQVAAVAFPLELTAEQLSEARAVLLRTWGPPGESGGGLGHGGRDCVPLLVQQERNKGGLCCTALDRVGCKTITVLNTDLQVLPGSQQPVGRRAWCGLGRCAVAEACTPLTVEAAPWCAPVLQTTSAFSSPSSPELHTSYGWWWPLRCPQKPGRAPSFHPCMLWGLKQADARPLAVPEPRSEIRCTGPLSPFSPTWPSSLAPPLLSGPWAPSPGQPHLCSPQV